MDLQRTVNQDLSIYTYVINPAGSVVPFQQQVRLISGYSKEEADNKIIQEYTKAGAAVSADLKGVIKVENFLKTIQVALPTPPVALTTSTEVIEKPISTLRQRQDVYNEILGELKKVGDIMFTETTEKDIWDLVYNKLTNKEERSIESLEE